MSTRPGQITLSILIVAMFGMILYYFLSMRGVLPELHRELVAGMIGALTMKFGTVCDFWFSANIGSERTKELLAKATFAPKEDCIDLNDEVK